MMRRWPAMAIVNDTIQEIMDDIWLFWVKRLCELAEDPGVDLKTDTVLLSGDVARITRGGATAKTQEEEVGRTEWQRTGEVCQWIHKRGLLRDIPAFEEFMDALADKHAALRGTYRSEPYRGIGWGTGIDYRVLVDGKWMTRCFCAKKAKLEDDGWSSWWQDRVDLQRSDPSECERRGAVAWAKYDQAWRAMCAECPDRVGSLDGPGNPWEWGGEEPDPEF
jgi:hypothetical protein